MTITLHHHPLSRAAGTLWALEEAGCPYALEFVDFQAAANKDPAFRAVNPMTKLPTLVDEDVTVTEAAAIALYLGDRYAAGRLAPAFDDPRRGTYLRWSFYAPSVIEPGCMAKAANWEFQPGRVGWGTYDDMVATIHEALGEGPWILGEQFTMADVIFGGTLRWMTMFGMLERSPAIGAYVDRINGRPASVKAKEVNDRVIKERGLQPG